MTPQEFVHWFRGFAQAANNYTLTPKQWDDVREMLAKVKDEDDNVVLSRYKSEGWGTDHTGGPAKITYETKSKKQLLKTEPNH
jgi:ribosomal protein S24E